MTTGNGNSIFSSKIIKDSEKEEMGKEKEKKEKISSAFAEANLFGEESKEKPKDDWTNKDGKTRETKEKEKMLKCDKEKVKKEEKASKDEKCKMGEVDSKLIPEKEREKEPSKERDIPKENKGKESRKGGEKVVAVGFLKSPGLRLETLEPGKEQKRQKLDRRSSLLRSSTVKDHHAGL
ncbi:THO complex subunit 2-like [Vombatus ursinus]|uniref:THO complex subunit 2-like n=1 Tax=Vombatus ursinus TaxID=29139 RepID=UPI000FFD9CC8|nr:THO complex subunit 2-like [Vombatus ursinus]